MFGIAEHNVKNASIVVCLKCDVFNVVSFQLSNTGSSMVNILDLEMYTEIAFHQGLSGNHL